ncbi:MAG TPA: hypothetical protein VLL08_23160 [Kineosporiaceae bacterium]|nr:hypothetical protein [Kineosporiaceae bacterium]
MTDEPSTDQLRTALVVLAVPADQPAGTGGYTIGHRPAGLPEGAESVRTWFSEKGYKTDPVVGIAFAISAPGTLFNSTFGIDDAGTGSTQQLDQAALAGHLDADLLRYVAAVVIGPPPDFGPGNP